MKELSCVMGIISFICQSKTITNDYFHLKNEGRYQRSNNNVLLFFLIIVDQFLQWHSIKKHSKILHVLFSSAVLIMNHAPTIYRIYIWYVGAFLKSRTIAAGLFLDVLERSMVISSFLEKVYFVIPFLYSKYGNCEENVAPLRWLAYDMRSC